MGNNQSVNAVALNNLTNKVKFDIVVKCLEHLDFMENTSATIDMDIIGLNKELAKIVNDFREDKLMNDAPADVYRDIVEDVEKFCNGNKYSIRKLFETLNQACTVFEALSSHISPIDYVEDEDSTFFSDSDCRLEIYEACTSRINGYYADLQHTTLSHNIISSRMSTLRRMLYKEAENTVKEAVREKIFNFKSRVIEEIDNLFCMGMSQHRFDVDEAVKARDLLKSIIVIGQNARSLLVQSKYNEQILLNAAFDEICFYVENVVRRVQLAFSLHSSEALDLLMDLEIDDSNHDDALEHLTESNTHFNGRPLLSVPVADGRDPSSDEDDEEVDSEEQEEEDEEEEEQREQQFKKETAKALLSLTKKKNVTAASATPTKKAVPAPSSARKTVSAKAVIEVESDSDEEEDTESESEEESESEPVLTRSAIKAGRSSSTATGTSGKGKNTTVVTVVATPSRSSARNNAAATATAANPSASKTSSNGSNDRKRKESASSAANAEPASKRVQHSRKAKNAV